MGEWRLVDWGDHVSIDDFIDESEPAMYCDFYGLAEMPFNLTPDPKFLFMTASHQEALAQMLCGITMRRGLVAVTGEVGTGKTTLVRALLQQLDAKTQAAYIYHAILGGKGLFQSICREFGIPFFKSESKTELIFNLHDHLISVFQSGGNAVLIIDEAQNLKPHLLEEIRLISNLETVNTKLIQLVLIGQPEFGNTLERQDMRQLKQRIALRCHLARLNRLETEGYIQHRLTVAGYSGPKPLFAPAAVDEIFGYTQGLPRAINILCDNALIMGYSIGARTISADIVKKVAFEDVYQEMELAKPTVSRDIQIKTIAQETPSSDIAIPLPKPLDSIAGNNNGHSSWLTKLRRKLLPRKWQTHKATLDRTTGLQNLESE